MREPRHFPWNPQGQAYQIKATFPGKKTGFVPRGLDPLRAASNAIEELSIGRNSWDPRIDRGSDAIVPLQNRA